MIKIGNFLILIFIIHITNGNNSSYFKSISLSDEEFLIIKEKGIYTLNKNILTLIEKYNFENNNENTAILSKNDINHIFYFDYLEEQNIMIIFIKEYMYIFSKKGDLIQKKKFFDQLPSNYYIILPYKYSLNDLCIYYYVVVYINNDTNIIFNIYEYDYFSNSNKLFFQYETILPNYVSEMLQKKEYYFTSQIMLDKSNKPILICNFENKNTKELISQTYELNIKEKKINIINSIKPLTNLKIEGKIIKLINNKEKNENRYLQENKENDGKGSTDINNGNGNNNEDDKNNMGSENNKDGQENKDNETNDNEKNNGQENNPKGTTPSGYEFDFDKKETNIPKDEIKNNRDEIVSNLDKGENYKLKGDGYEINIAPMGQKDDSTSTSIDFLSCEQKLRESYGLNESSVLTVFQTETTNNNEKSLTNKVQYVVYNENNEQLDLSVCQDEQIRINYALKENSTLDTNLYSNFIDKGIDILNSSDSFFNDICYSYSENGSDIILSDRISEIYQNYSLCDDGCEYESIDTENLTVSCTCSISTNDTDDEDDDTADNVKEIILGLFQNSTFGVVKCYKLVFNLSNKLSNIGFWVFLVIIIVHIPLYVLFFKNGISPIKLYIQDEMTKYHYLENVDNPPKKSDNNSEKSENNNFKKNNNNNDNLRKSESFNFAKNTNETLNKEENEETDKRINVVIPDIVPKDGNAQQKIKIQMETIKSNDLIETDNHSSTKREETNNIINVYNKNKENKVEKKKVSYFLIKMDANNSSNGPPPESNYILKNYVYETALKYEKRTFWRILYIVMISKDNILNTFILKSPLESQPLRICLLLFAYSCDLALNTLFYFSDNISDRHHYSGDSLFWYSLLNNILISVISTLLSLILGSVLQCMTNSKTSIENEFKKEEKKMRENKNYTVSDERKKQIFEKINNSLKCLKLKMVIFIILDLAILLFFFYFVSSFCHVYSSTQVSWISDAIVSIIISFPIELAIALAVTIVYKLSLKYKWEMLYKLSMMLA